MLDRPARPHPALGQAPRAARPVVGRVGAAVGRRHARSRATSSWPSRAPRTGSTSCVVDVSGKGDAAATRALLLSGAFGGLITAVPPDEFLDRGQRLPARPRLGRGLRHRGPALPRPDQRSLRGADGRPPARPSTCAAGSGRWSALQSRRSGPRADRGRGVRERPRRDATRRRDAALHRRPGRDRQARHRARHRPPDRRGREGAARGRRTTGVDRLVDRLGSKDDDRALLLVHRRPEPVSGAVAGWGRARLLWHHDTRSCGPGGTSEGPAHARGCSSMVEPQSSKLATRVRFPSSALRRPPDALRRAFWRGVA